jgi:hypothetical protein
MKTLLWILYVPLLPWVWAEHKLQQWVERLERGRSDRPSEHGGSDARQAEEAP